MPPSTLDAGGLLYTSDSGSSFPLLLLFFSTIIMRMGCKNNLKEKAWEFKWNEMGLTIWLCLFEGKEGGCVYRDGARVESRRGSGYSLCHIFNLCSIELLDLHFASP